LNALNDCCVSSQVMQLSHTHIKRLLQFGALMPHSIRPVMLGT